MWAMMQKLRITACSVRPGSGIAGSAVRGSDIGGKGIRQVVSRVGVYRCMPETMPMPALGPDAPKPWFLTRRATPERSRGNGEAGRRRVRQVSVRAGAVLAALLAAAATAGLAAGLLLAHLNGGPTAGWARSSGHDALWMGRIWAQGAYTRADLEQLAGHVNSSGISEVWVFAGQMDADGHLKPARYADARSFLAAFHAAVPRVRVSAWISGVLGPGSIRLADAATRDAIVSSA